MSATVRPFNSLTDAGGVSELFNRYLYGPIRNGVPLDEQSFNCVLTERDAQLVLIAEDKGRVVGTIGFLSVSGRRVAKSTELFAGLFLIDPAYRAGFLAGNLFTSAFSRLVSKGVRSLRLEVDPANSRAFPLYVRVGFRGATVSDNLLADEDGFVELVSHLPGVVADLMADFASDVPLDELFSSFSWRTMASGRRKTLRDGLLEVDGEIFVDYDFRINHNDINVRVNMDNGETVSTHINGVEVERAIKRPGQPQLQGGRPKSDHSLMGSFAVSVDHLGALHVTNRSIGPVLIDPLPVLRGRKIGWRRLLRHRVETQRLEDGWISEYWESGVRVLRRVAVHENSIHITVETTPPTPVTSLPWVEFGPADLYFSRRKGEPLTGGPHVRGLFPQDATDFEAAIPAEQVQPGARSLWIDVQSQVGIETEWRTPCDWRVEGSYLPMSSAATGNIEYVIRPLESAGQELELEQADEPDLFRPPTGISVNTALTPTALEWSPAQSRGRDLLQGTSSGAEAEFLVEPGAGIVSWKLQDRPVLASPYPSSRPYGSLERWKAGMWIGVQGPREDPEQGISWGAVETTLPFVQSLAALAAKRTGGWAIEASGNEESLFRLTVHAGIGNVGKEIVAHLTPKTDLGHILLADTSGAPWQANRGRVPWRAWTRRVSIPLAHGTELVIGAKTDDANGQQILIRSTPSTLLISLVARSASEAHTLSWDLHVRKRNASQQIL